MAIKWQQLGDVTFQSNYAKLWKEAFDIRMIGHYPKNHVRQLHCCYEMCHKCMRKGKNDDHDYKFDKFVIWIVLPISLDEIRSPKFGSSPYQNIHSSFVHISWLIRFECSWVLFRVLRHTHNRSALRQLIYECSKGSSMSFKCLSVEYWRHLIPHKSA